MKINTYANTFLLLAVTGIGLAGCSEQTISDAAWNEGWTYWSDKTPLPCTVNLPHDAMQAQERDAETVSGRSTGFFGGDVYHYEKTLHVSDQMLQKHITLQFEGIYRNPQVYINGQLAGGTRYGYLPFQVVADGLLKAGDNIIRIDADNSDWPNSRWYSGGGIYRPIHLCVQDAQTYIEDIQIETLGIDPAQVQIRIGHHGGKARTSIWLQGHEVAQAEGDQPIIEISDAQLWSAECPVLYEARVELLNEQGKTIEKQSHKFGIRQLAWNGEQGLTINGKSVLLKGGCLHHDEGLLGACEYEDAALRKVERMKEYGFNAIRSAHNPISEAMLRVCDSLGMYVMDELWDMWYSYKNPEDYAKDFKTNWEQDITTLVNRDYNHPSVILYSIGNEVVEPSTKEGQAMERQLVDKLHALDKNRPVTCGMNLMIQLMNAAMGMNITQNNGESYDKMKQVSSEEFNALVATQGQRMMEAVLRPEVDVVCSPGLDMLDIAGYNYASLRAEIDAELHPERVQVGTETFPHDIATNWALVERLPQLVGDFMWTAWDYLGEVGIGAWTYSDDPAMASRSYPWLTAGAGALDLIGNPTGEAFWAKAVWSKDNRPYLAVRPLMNQPLVKAIWRNTNSIPSWSWPGQEGKMATVEVFTSAPVVQLFLNDQLIGQQTPDHARATFELPYQPGILRAVTTDPEGHELSTQLISAIGSPRIVISPERDSYQVGDLIYVNVELQGENGVVISNLDQQLTIEVDGAELLAFGSAQPYTSDRFQTGRYSTYFGQAQAILKASKSGIIHITIKGEGLEDAQTTISI